MDPFDDEFEFKPLTEGLGFHKKADQQVTASGREKPAVQSRRSSQVEPLPPRHLHSDAENDLLGRPNPDFNSRSSASISDLMASLPPALDFVGEDTDRPTPVSQKSNRSVQNQRATLPAPTVAQPKPQVSRPQIFQPLSRNENGRTDIARNDTFKPTQAKASPAPYSQPIRPPVPPSMKQDSGANARSTPASSGYRQRLEESFARAFPSVESGRAPTKTKSSRPNAQPNTQPNTQAKSAVGDLTPVTAHFGAGALDALMVTGMSTLLLVFILAITHVNLRGLLGNAETDVPTRIHLFLLVITVLQLYMLTAHSFFGTTLGEWAFEIQLGTDEEQKGAFYPVQAAFRTLLLTVTGFVILPGLSLLMKRDLAGTACGLQLYQRAQSYGRN